MTKLRTQIKEKFPLVDCNCREMAEADRSSQELLGDDRLLTALASGCHVETAARLAGISERTAYRRLADSKFRSQLELACESLRQAILARLADAGHDAIDTIWNLMLDSEDENIRLKAAKALLDSLAGSSRWSSVNRTFVRERVEITESQGNRG